MQIRIAVGTDHGGYEAKEDLANWLEEKGYHVVDCGTFSPDAADYPIFARRVAENVAGGAAHWGIIFCRSGVGVTMVANKVPGARAALCMSPRVAKLSRQHNNANILVMGIDHLEYDLKEVVSAWFDGAFEGGRHERRVSQIELLDELLSSHLPTRRALASGQSIWLDEKHGALFTEDAMEPLVRYYGVTGALMSPLQINRLALAGESPLPEMLEQLRLEKIDAADACERVVIALARRTAQLLMPAAQWSGGRDGVVAFGLHPRVWDDSIAFADRAEEIASEIGLQSIAFKISPGDAAINTLRDLTRRGLTAIYEGVFSLEQWDAAAQAYEDALRERLEAGKPVHHLQSAATISVKTIENELLHHAGPGGQNPGEMMLDPVHHSIAGSAALSLCREIVYRQRGRFVSESFAPLARRGASVLKPIWIDTYDENDTPGAMNHFGEELVARNTIHGLTGPAFKRFVAGTPIIADRLALGARDTSDVEVDFRRAGFDPVKVGQSLRAAYRDQMVHDAGVLEKTLRAMLGC